MPFNQLSFGFFIFYFFQFLLLLLLLLFVKYVQIKLLYIFQCITKYVQMFEFHLKRRVFKLINSNVCCDNNNNNIINNNNKVCVWALKCSLKVSARKWIGIVLFYDFGLDRLQIHTCMCKWLDLRQILNMHKMFPV